MGTLRNNKKYEMYFAIFVSVHDRLFLKRNKEMKTSTGVMLKLKVKKGRRN